MKKQGLIIFMITLTQTAFSQSSYETKAKELVAKMTLEEKASLCSGRDFWSTKPVDRLNIPSVFMTDGPHGLRKAVGTDFTNSVPATCFPTAAGLASSWNPALLNEMGIALGEECQANNVQFLLGPGVNMKRSPLGGQEL
jgi:beta-glucosidase